MTVSFSDLFDIIANNTLSRSDLTTIGTVKNIHYGDVLIKFGDNLNAKDSSIPYIKDSNAIRNKDYLHNGDIIIADTAEDSTVGKSTEIYGITDEKIVSGLHTIPVRPKKHFASKFLGYYINSPSYHNQLVTLMQGIKVFSISKGNILHTIIAYPNIETQTKIVQMLCLVDRRIETQQKLLNALKSYKRGVLQRIFASAKRTLPLNQISEYYSAANTMAIIENLANGEYPVYDASGIVAKVNKFDFSDAYVAIIKDGSGVGRLQLCEAKSSIIGTLGALFPKNCTVGYLYAVLQTIDYRQFVTGMAIPHIYYKDYKNTEIPFPDDSSRNKIEAIANAIDKILDNESKLLNLLQIQKASLLQQLFI